MRISAPKSASVQNEESWDSKGRGVDLRRFVVRERVVTRFFLRFKFVPVGLRGGVGNRNAALHNYSALPGLVKKKQLSFRPFKFSQHWTITKQAFLESGMKARMQAI